MILTTDKCFCSAIFAVGGHNWCIRYYSEGQDPRSDFVSIFLQLTGEFVEVTASFKFRIMANTGLLPSLHTAHTTSHVVFNGENPMQGFTSFMRKKDLEFLLKDVKDGCLVIECDITVIKEIQVKKSTITSDFDIHVPPPSDLSYDLRRLLESEEEADVTFKVKGEVFSAHKILLAVRSVSIYLH